MNEINAALLNSLRSSKGILINGDLITEKVRVIYQNTYKTYCSLNELPSFIKNKDVLYVDTRINSKWFDLYQGGSSFKIFQKGRLFYCMKLYNSNRVNSFVLRCL